MFSWRESLTREQDEESGRGSWKSDKDNDRDLHTLHTSAQEPPTNGGRNSLIGRSEIKQEIVETVWQVLLPKPSWLSAIKARIQNIIQLPKWYTQLAEL